jgi:hypothetical protein
VCYYTCSLAVYLKAFVSACVVEVCGTIVRATSDLHTVVTCFDSTRVLLPCFKKIVETVNQSVG